MGLTLKFEHPHFPEGHKFSINYLGNVENGGTAEVAEDDERLFVATHGKTVEDAFKGNANVTVSGTSALSKDETDQLIAQANPTTEEAPLPDATNPANGNQTETTDPNDLIMGGGENS